MRTIKITPNASQSEASIAADLERSDELAARLLADGVQSWRSYYRWLGPLKIKVAKEVGPPPWRFPHLGFYPWRGNRLGFSLVVGWRSTAYRLFVLWAGMAPRGATGGGGGTGGPHL